MLREYQWPKEAPDKKVQKEDLKRLRDSLAPRQLQIRDAGIPVVVLVEGMSAAGKGSLINELISELDPRFCSFFSLDSVKNTGSDYPFLHPFFTALPENGKLLFLDGGWMEKIICDYHAGLMDTEEFGRRLRSVRCFERQLKNNGYLLIKLFVHVSKETQAKRLRDLASDWRTEWRVTEGDRWQNRVYDTLLDSFDAMMDAASESFPWHILDGENRVTCALEAFRILEETIDAAVAAGKFNGPSYEEAFPMTAPPRLSDADLTASVTEEEYKKELKKLQKKANKLQQAAYRRRIPVIVCYEGWDAAGKGGNIKRLVYPLDPRGFTVYPIASPEKFEKARHHLWRFWTRLPSAGKVAVFDRTWYGRVMVERIEGYCTENDYLRAYNEMNEFERDLHEWGAVILKFWIQIDADTQLARFEDRQNTPEKQWKITEEDWRNREKWDQYETAVAEMLEKTSTQYAPWHIIESTDKKYARLKTLRLFNQALEEALS